MVSLLASSAVDRGFEPRSCRTKDYNIGICCFSAKDTALRRKSKDCLVQNQYNVYEWNNMSTCGTICLPVEQYVYLWTVVSKNSN